MSSLVIASLVALLSARLLRETGTWREPILLLICTVELTLANHWLVPTAPTSLWREASPVAEMASTSWTYRASRWWPDEFATHSSASRMEEIVQWERQTLAGRYALLDDVPLVNTSPRPLASAEYDRLLDHVNSGGQLDETALRRLGVQLLIVSQNVEPPFAERVPTSGLSNDAALWRIKPAPDLEVKPTEHTFNPRAFQRGAVISATSWLALIAIGAAIWWRGRARPLKSSSSALA